MVVRECEKVVELSLDKEADYFWFTSWCGFPTYELDFGWGKPVWVSSASPGVQNLIVLMDSVGDIGGIEAWITMDEADMMKFEQEAGNSLVIVKKLLDRSGNQHPWWELSKAIGSRMVRRSYGYRLQA